MKRWLAVLLGLCLLFGLIGCGEADVVDDQGEESDEQEQEEDEAADPSAGEPFAGDSFSKMVGNFTIETEWIPFAEPLAVDSISEGIVALSGESFYILTDGAVKQYALEDGKMVYKNDVLPDNKIKKICTDDAGVLYVSAFMSDFVGYSDGAALFAHEGLSTVAMHPSGKWGISYFTGPDTEKVTLGDGTVESKDVDLKELKLINNIDIGENHIFVSGDSVANERHGVFVYDLKNKLKLTLGDKESGEKDSLGSTTAVVETKNGFMALDGNMRVICFWKADGTFIGKIADEDLFGTDYPWLRTAVLMEDGSILVGMTQKREDKSADEFILYKLTGF